MFSVSPDVHLNLQINSFSFNFGDARADGRPSRTFIKFVVIGTHFAYRDLYMKAVVTAYIWDAVQATNFRGRQGKHKAESEKRRRLDLKRNIA